MRVGGGGGREGEGGRREEGEGRARRVGERDREGRIDGQKGGEKAEEMKGERCKRRGGQGN